MRLDATVRGYRREVVTCEAAVANEGVTVGARYSAAPIFTPERPSRTRLSAASTDAGLLHALLTRNGVFLRMMTRTWCGWQHEALLQPNAICEVVTVMDYLCEFVTVMGHRSEVVTGRGYHCKVVTVRGYRCEVATGRV